MDEEQVLLPLGSVIRDPLGGTYIVETLLGQGGFGAVYLVREQHNQQQVFALKEEMYPNSYRRASFTGEADILRRLQHPALPRVYRVFGDVQRQRSYMLMEYISGQNLDALRREQPERRFPLPVVLELLEPIVDALIYLHRQDPPIVHRDVKPANIIVPTNHAPAVLVDFGLAKEYVEDRTTNAVRPATPGFAAPEHYGGGTTPRTDLYSLGATFYALLTGEVPPHALRRAINRDADLLTPAQEIVPAIPVGIAEAIARAMAVQSEDRFETVEQFWQELSRRAAEQPGQPAHQGNLHVQPIPPEPDHPEPPEEPLYKRPRWRPSIQRRSILVVLALILLLASVGGGAALVGLRILGSLGIAQSGLPSVAASPTTPAAFCKGTASVAPVSTSTSESATYPLLSSAYAGTIYDFLTQQQTPLCLMSIQQNQKDIYGIFQGLGLVGTFQGTVTEDEQLSFTLPLYANTEKLVCKGAIKVAGDLTGTFQVYDQQGNFTGESGFWNASAYKPPPLL